MNYETRSPRSDTGTGIAPPSSYIHSSRSVSQKEKVDLWFCDQLEDMSNDDAFVCLMILFPLLETISRFELKIPDDQDVTFSDNSPVLKWFSEFMSIPEQHARDIWDAFRNGLLHRAMIKGTVPYTLTGAKAGRCAEIVDGHTKIYVWDLRDAVVIKLRAYHKQLWRTSAPLPNIYIQG
jgi:hypothetical protein